MYCRQNLIRIPRFGPRGYPWIAASTNSARKKLWLTSDKKNEARAASKPTPWRYSEKSIQQLTRLKGRNVGAQQLSIGDSAALQCLTRRRRRKPACLAAGRLAGGMLLSNQWALWWLCPLPSKRKIAALGPQRPRGVVISFFCAAAQGFYRLI